MESEEWVSAYAAELDLVRSRIILLYPEYMFPRDQKEGLTHVQAVLLKRLLDSGNSTVSALADYLGVTMAAVSSLVERMVKCGLLDRKRSESDRRVVQVSLAAKGREAIEDFISGQRDRMEKLIGRMGRENCRLFLEGQRVLLEALEQVVKEKKEQECSDGSKDGNKK